MSNARRVLIIGADGLRPDLLDPLLMPNVAALAAGGVHGLDHHAVYPTHTRVNISALATGTMPGQHGIVANTMLVPNATEDHIIDTGSYQHINALEEASGGYALLVPSLGDLLAERNERVAVAGTSSSGASMLWTHRHLGRMVNVYSTYGIADLYDLRDKLGEPPAKEQGAPQLSGQGYATAAVTQLFLSDPRNRVVVLWMNEPDTSFHYAGLGSPESIEALRKVDQCVGEIVAALEAQGLREQFDIFFISDHGHSTVEAHNTLREYLMQAQKEIGRALPPLATASDYIYARPGTSEPTAAELAPLVEWLNQQPWAGVVLGGTAELAVLPGVLPLAALWKGHLNARRPLLAVSPRWHDNPNEHGVPGSVMSLTTQSALRSSHGSLSPFDLHATLIANGPSFRRGVQSTWPTGAVDLLPTILTLLDLPLPAHLDGRVLWELFAKPVGEVGPSHDEVLRAAHGDGGQVLLHRVGPSLYVHGALQPESAFELAAAR
ncbi:MAG: alkaline phosphatase family protein [Caldilineaceae bacterium]|nr:alkaline phosphatase family protein [Caldilineaceae bacterium]